MRDNPGLAKDRTHRREMLPRPEGSFDVVETGESLRDLDRGSDHGDTSCFQSASAAKSRRPLKRAMFGLLLVAGGRLGVWYGHHWWSVGRFIVSTDDAYVRAHNAT